MNPVTDPYPTGTDPSVGNSRDRASQSPSETEQRPPALIDVVIPAYNCAATIEAAVGSILAQTVRDIRVIVVDDGSTDATREVVQRMADVDARVHVLTQANSGIVDALNLGLDHCTAEYFGRHDGDDLAYPHRLETQLALLRALPDVVAVGAHARLIDGDGRPTGEYSRAPSPDTADARSVPAKEPYLLHPFLLARLAAVRGIGGYRHNFLAEDSDLYWRLQEVGGLVNIPEVLGDYRVHAGSTTSRSIARGRMNALFSELAAVSALRRRAGRPDIAFTRDFVAEVGRCDGIAQVFDVGGRLVDDDERRWLRIAMAAKLIDLSFIRRYALEADDCRFVRAAFDAGWTVLDAANRAANGERLTQAAKALIERGRLDLAHTIAPRRIYLRLAPRIAFRWLLPDSARRWAKRLVGRSAR